MKNFVCTLSEISPEGYGDIVRRISVMCDTFRRVDENTLADGDVTIAFHYNSDDKTAEIQSDIDLPDEIFEGYEADICRSFAKTEKPADSFGNVGFFGISAVFAAAVFGIIILDTALGYAAIVISAGIETTLPVHLPPLVISAALFAVISRLSGRTGSERAAFRLVIIASAVIWLLEILGYSLLPVYAPVLGAAYFCTLGRVRERIGGNAFKGESAQLALTLGAAAVMWAVGAVTGGLIGELLLSVARSAAKLSALGMVLAVAARLLSGRSEVMETR